MPSRTRVRALRFLSQYFLRKTDFRSRSIEAMRTVYEEYAHKFLKYSAPADGYARRINFPLRFVLFGGCDLLRYFFRYVFHYFDVKGSPVLCFVIFFDGPAFPPCFPLFRARA